MKPPISVEEFRRLFIYDPDTGIFTRRATGEPWGKINPQLGYVTMATPGASVTIPGSRRPQYGHILAWWYMTGNFPTKTIDHRDRVKSNNRWNNLRLATMPEQVRNVGRRKNQAKFIGVAINHGRWAARISINMKRTYLGTFDTPEEAHAVYESKRLELAGEFTPI